MRNTISFFIKYPVWTNVLMISIFIFGFISLGQLRYSLFPELEPDIISIQVLYPGTSPEEVEEGVVLKIEETLEGFEGIERITSTSRENIGNVNVEVSKYVDRDKVLTDVKNSIDRINSFPLDAEKPVIFEQKFLSRSISLILSGETDLYNLKYVADNLKEELLAQEGISQVTIQGLPSLEFSIEVSEGDLRMYGLTFNDISEAVRSANINISGGKFETKDEEILIRAYGRKYDADNLGQIFLRGNPDGTILYLGDIADIKEQWEDTPNKSYYNNKSAVIINVDKTKNEDIIAVADRTKEILRDFNERYETVKAVILDDQTVSLRQRLELLVSNGLFGLLFVIISLGFFLNLRLSFWVSIGIPFSFAGMFIIAGMAGITINVISLFGMIVVIGILVDDAIVVGENIYKHAERGKPAHKAAVDGTVEMLGPVTTSVTTTILAFTPFFFLDGFLGKFIWHMAIVVIAALFFSLIEAFLILPSHLAHSKALNNKGSKVRNAIDNIIGTYTNKVYAPSLRTALKYKWITIVIPVFFILLTIGLLGGGLIGFTFFPFIDGDTLPINISLVPGRQEDDTSRILKKIERAVWTANEELKKERADGRDIVLGIKRDIGTSDLGDSGSHTGRITVQLLDGKIRELDSYIIANEVRKLVGPIPEVQNISYGRTSFFGKPVSISILGNDIEQLSKARDLMVEQLNNFNSLKDVTDSKQEGRREINIVLKDRAYALGLSLEDIARQVRQGFFGQEIQRIQRGKDEIRIWVRYKLEDRRSIGNIENMRIKMADGSEYPFTELADYSILRGVSVINRFDGNREIKVEANLANVGDDLPPILAEIQDEVIPGVLSQVNGVRVSFEGQSRDQAKTSQSMARAFPIALGGMFILIILVFRSYLQAVAVFSLIPIGILGAIWGHGIQGIQVNSLSIYGIIALSGIIINDSIVFVDKINRNLREGQKVFDAVYNAGLSRLRPILLTTMTTSFGLAPIIFETSRQAQFLIPMAVSVAYGLLFGTFILLIILPALYLVINSIRVFAVYILTGNKPEPEEVEPAVRETRYLNPESLEGAINVAE